MKRTLALWLVGLAAAAHAEAAWRWDSPRPQGNDLHAVFGVGSEVIAVGDLGAILRSGDGGKEWASVPSPTHASLDGVGGSARDDLWAVGARGTILRSSDGGASWRPSASGTTTDLHAVWSPSRHEVWVVGEQGAILLSRDDGATWQAVHADPGKSLRAVWGAGGVVYAAGLGGYVLASKDQGKSWDERFDRFHATGMVDFDAIAGPGAERVILGGAIAPGPTAGDTRGYLLVETSVDGGASWRGAPVGPLAPANRARIRALASVGKRELWAVGDGGLAARSRDGGVEWQPLESGVALALLGVWSGAKGTIAVGDGATLLYGSDGATLRPRTRGASGVELAAVWGAAWDDLYAVGDRCRVLHTRDGGESWTQTQLCADERALAGVWAAGASEVYAVGARGLVARSSDGGAHWQAQPSHTGADLHAVWASWPERVWAVGDAGTVLRTGDHGATWSRVETHATATLAALWGPTRDELYAVGAQGTILHTLDGGASWKPLKSGTRASLYAVRGRAPDDVWAVGERATVLRSRDGGKSWRTVPVTIADSAPAHVELRGLWVTTGGEVWIVGRSLDPKDSRGLVLRAIDVGDGDQGARVVEEGPGVRAGLAAIWGAGATDLYVVGEAGAILQRHGAAN